MLLGDAEQVCPKHKWCATVPIGGVANEGGRAAKLSKGSGKAFGDFVESPVVLVMRGADYPDTVPVPVRFPPFAKGSEPLHNPSEARSLQNCN
jgi:hypothetical protein